MTREATGPALHPERGGRASIVTSNTFQLLVATIPCSHKMATHPPAYDVTTRALLVYFWQTVPCGDSASLYHAV